jgi:hypothetical protein
MDRIPLPTVLAASDGVRGAVTVIGTLAFVACCFVLVEALDRHRSSDRGAAVGARTDVVDGAPAPDPLSRLSSVRPGPGAQDEARRRARGVVVGSAGAVLVGAALVPLRSTIGLASIALTLVLVVLVAAAVGGRVAAATTSAAAALVFNVVHTEPRGTFHIRRTSDVVTTVLMIVVGVAAGELVARRERVGSGRRSLGR